MFLICELAGVFCPWLKQSGHKVPQSVRRDGLNGESKEAALRVDSMDNLKQAVVLKSNFQIPAYNRRQNQAEDGRNREKDTTGSSLSAAEDHPTLREFLFALLASPRLLESVAKNKRSQCEATLARWKEAGYPHPGDWPHIGYGPIVSFSFEWLINGPFSKEVPSLASIRKIHPILSPQNRREALRLFWGGLRDTSHLELVPTTQSEYQLRRRTRR